MAKVHLEQPEKSTHEDYISTYYAACGVVIEQDNQRTLSVHNLGTRNTREVTCENCKQTNYYKEEMSEPNKQLKDEVDKQIDSSFDKAEDWIQTNILAHMSSEKGRKWMSRVFMLIVIIGLLIYAFA